MARVQRFDRRGSLAILLLLTMPGAPLAARAAEPGTLSLVVENDVFAGTDRNYSNGVKASYVWPATETPSMARRINSFLFGEPERTVFWGLALGQNLYTPETISDPNPLPNQHPYAG